jgi:hypothetical protein
MGRKVRVSLQASEVVVFDGRAVMARHERVAAESGHSVQLDHYLEVLETKPRALSGSTALARERQPGAFTSVHEAFSTASRRVNGDADGTRQLIDVLLHHRSMGAGDVQVGITAGGSCQCRCRRGGGTQIRIGLYLGWVRFNVHRVVSLTQRRLTDPAAVFAGLPPDTRPFPLIGAYDELLAKRTQKSAERDLKGTYHDPPHRPPRSRRPCAAAGA